MATSDQAGFWRRCADSYALVITTAAERGVSQRLLALMRADEERYRRWADEIEAQERGVPWSG